MQGADRDYLIVLVPEHPAEGELQWELISRHFLEVVVRLDIGLLLQKRRFPLLQCLSLRLKISDSIFGFVGNLQAADERSDQDDLEQDNPVGQYPPKTAVRTLSCIMTHNIVSFPYLPLM